MHSYTGCAHSLQLKLKLGNQFPFPLIQNSDPKRLISCKEFLYDYQAKMQANVTLECIINEQESSHHFLDTIQANVQAVHVTCAPLLHHEIHDRIITSMLVF